MSYWTQLHPENTIALYNTNAYKNPPKGKKFKWNKYKIYF